MADRRRLIAGCMSGTSLDAVDAALVAVRGEGEAIRAEARGFASRPLGDLGDRLRALAEGGAAPAGELARLALELGEAHAEVVAGLAEGGDPIDLVAAHGQTLFHDPPASLQLINPWPIASRLRCAVVTDLRGADLSAGGQGAPITPVADWVLFRDREEERVIVNLGGFCNATMLPAGIAMASVRGRDVCACNHVLDGAARAGLGAPFDEDGRAAAEGRDDPEALAELDRILAEQAESGRSLGTGDEAQRWVERWSARLAGPALVATAAEGVGGTIGRWLARAAPTAWVHLAGGGVRTTDALGVAPAAREAAAMAVLGALAADGVAITTPASTGRGARVPSAGSWVNVRTTS